MLKQTLLGLLLFAISFNCNQAKSQEVVSDFAVEFNVTGNNPSVNQRGGDFLSYAYKGQKMSMTLALILFLGNGQARNTSTCKITIQVYGMT